MTGDHNEPEPKIFFFYRMSLVLVDPLKTILLNPLTVRMYDVLTIAGSTETV